MANLNLLKIIKKSDLLFPLLFVKLHIIFKMAEEGEEGAEVKVEPDDPEYALEEHIVYKRKQEALNVQLRKLIQEGLSDFKQIMDGTAYAYTKVSLPNKGITAVTEIIAEYPHLR